MPIMSAGTSYGYAIAFDAVINEPVSLAILHMFESKTLAASLRDAEAGELGFEPLPCCSSNVSVVSSVKKVGCTVAGIFLKQSIFPP
jgi:hypothetical protein